MSPIGPAWACRLIQGYDRWECIHFAASLDRPVFEAFRDRGFHVAAVPGTALGAGSLVFDKLAEAFEFPPHGQNWDAMHDWLGDLSWLPAPGYLLIVDHVDAAGLSPNLVALLQMWPDLAQRWSEKQTPFHLVVLLDHLQSA